MWYYATVITNMFRLGVNFLVWHLFISVSYRLSVYLSIYLSIIYFSIKEITIVV